MESGSKCSCISAPCLPTSFAHGLTKPLESRNIRYKCLAKDWLGLKFIWALLIWFVWDNFCFPDLTIHVLAVGHWSFDGVWTQSCWWSLAAWLPLAVLVDSHCDMWYLWSCVVKIVWGSHNSEEITEQRKGTKKGSAEDIPYIIHARSSLILSTLKISQNSGTVMQEELEKKASRVRGMLNKLLRIDDENIRTFFPLWGAEKSVI